jgi:2,3-bisphosphoglycerate-independent phosphoglycerate mutase
MKCVIVRCEDDARPTAATASLLEGAKLLHLQQLAQAGAGGLIGHPRHAAATIDRLRLHHAFLGLQLHDPEAAPGWWYARSVGFEPEPGETVWCCEFMTHQEGRVIDVTAGRITTKESEALVHALNERLGSAQLRWMTGHGPHQLLIARDPSMGAEGAMPRCAPDHLMGQRWSAHLPKGPLGKTLHSLLEQASGLLEAHPVNRVRVDLGENPANLAWLWGPASIKPQRSFADWAGGPGAIVSTYFPMRGMSQALGLTWHEGPLSFEESSLHALTASMDTLLARHDRVYVHLRVAAVDPVERLCAMERIDQLLLKPLTERLPHHGPWRLLVAVDDHARQRVPFVAIGTGLPQQPLTHLSADDLTNSPLVFEEAEGAFSWLTQGVGQQAREAS